MKYIVYLTTNKKNNKIYIGIHQTENPDVFDGYLGDGAFTNKPSSYNKGKTHFHNAILKYGISSFHRKTLHVFDTLEEAKNMEASLVDENFIQRTDTYNMTIGGGIPPRHDKVIYEFDLSGNFIKKWNSIKSATDTYKCNKDRISMCIRDKRSFNNSYWAEAESINVSEYRLSPKGYVFQYNKNGLLLNTFENATEAATKLDISRDSIVSAVYDRTTCCGYYFLRADEDIELLLNEKSAKKLINVTPVYRYLITGEFDKEYSSMKEAEKESFTRSSIIKAIKNNKVYKNYKWSYNKTDIIEDFKESDLKAVKIAQYDLQHNLIKVWDSVKECKKEFPSCQKVCRKQRKSSNGFIFEYVS